MGAARLAQPVAELGGQAYVELVGDDRFEAVGRGRGQQRGLVETGQGGAPGGRGGRVVLLLEPGQVVTVTAVLGQGVRLAARLVEREQLVEEQPGRPAVPEDQVTADDEPVAALRAQAQQEQPEQRGRREVEPPVALRVRRLPQT